MKEKVFCRRPIENPILIIMLIFSIFIGFLSYFVSRLLTFLYLAFIFLTLILSFFKFKIVINDKGIKAEGFISSFYFEYKKLKWSEINYGRIIPLRGLYITYLDNNEEFNLYAIPSFAIIPKHIFLEDFEKIKNILNEKIKIE